MNKIINRTQKEINRDRRKFLDMVSKAGVSTSILRASSIAGGLFASRFAQAQSSAKKLVVIFHPNGSPNGNWAPNTGSIATQPFQVHGNQVALREMTISNPGNHGNIFQATGASSYNPSDAASSSYNVQVSKVIGNLTPYPSIELGVFTEGASNYINRRNGANIPLQNDPSVALNNFFSGSSGSSSSGGADLSVYDRRLSIVDSNREALSALRFKLGADEKQKLDEHLTALEQLERKIQSDRDNASGSGGGGGGSCNAPNLASGRTPLGDYRKQGDIAVAALACDLTNVVSIQFNETQATWIGADGSPDAVGWDQDHHKANHANGPQFLPDLIAYMNKGTAHIIQGLKNAGIFDQTVIVQVSEMGDGQDHTPGDGPIVVASGIPGLRGGYQRDGAEHLGVFNDVTRLLGLESSMGGDIADYGGGGHVI